MFNKYLKERDKIICKIEEEGWIRIQRPFSLIKKNAKVNTVLTIFKPFFEKDGLDLDFYDNCIPFMKEGFHVPSYKLGYVDIRYTNKNEKREMEWLCHCVTIPTDEYLKNLTEEKILNNSKMFEKMKRYVFGLNL